MNRFVCLVLCLASTLGWAQTRDSLLDFSAVAPTSADKHKLVQPTVQWLIKTDAPNYCAQIKEHDGFAVWQEGCVYWVLTPASCTIVTTGRTTNSQMGRLFLLCLNAGVEPA